MFGVKEYELIRSCLHFADNEGNQGDRLYKIRPILNFVQNTYTSIYSPGKELC